MTERFAEKLPPLDLEGSIIVLLTMLANQLSTSGSLTFEKRHGLTSSEWKVMAVIGTMPGVSAVEIAGLLSLDKAAISRTVRGLSDRGYLRVEPRGRRNLRALFLSEAGEAVHARGLETAAEREQCLLAPVEEEHRVLLHDLLRVMIRQLPYVYRLVDTRTEPAAEGRRPAPEPAMEGEDDLRDRIGRLESLLADLLLENAALRERQ